MKLCPNHKLEARLCLPEGLRSDALTDRVSAVVCCVAISHDSSFALAPGNLCPICYYGETHWLPRAAHEVAEGIRSSQQ